MKNTGCVHIYYGNGKGKTTAAMGLAVRAAGFGFPVLVYQFLKDNSSSERKSLEKIPHIYLMDGLEKEKFSRQMSQEEKQSRKQFYEKRFYDVIAAAGEKEVKLLVLDEIICVIQAGLFDEEILLAFLRDKREGLEVVLTGNTPGESLINAADYVTEMKKIKHPFDEGIPARDGIEK